MLWADSQVLLFLGPITFAFIVLLYSFLPVIVYVSLWLQRGAFPLTLFGFALVVVLDGIQDPQNFGGIVRSTAACGADAVLFPKDRAAPLSEAAIKAAAGAVEHVNLVRECVSIGR